MTISGICHNAAYDVKRLTREHAFRLHPVWARTIVYPWSRDMVIDNARELKQTGVSTLVVYNTESDGTAVDDVEGHARSLDAFLSHAEGAVAAIEPANEIDTPGWTDSRGRMVPRPRGRPISDDLIIKIGRRAAEVCARRNVLCLSPSLLTGPSEGRFERIARGLAGYVHAMAVHPYFRSIGGCPWDGWTFGSVEQAADECQQLGHGLPTWFTEVGCPSIYEDIGEHRQALFTSALRRFQHPSIPVIFQFALHDLVGSIEEVNDHGKDWGLIDQHGRHKEAYAAFADAGSTPLIPDQPYVGDGLQRELDRRGWTATSAEHGAPIAYARTDSGQPRLVTWDPEAGEASAWRKVG